MLCLLLCNSIICYYNLYSNNTFTMIIWFYSIMNYDYTLNIIVLFNLFDIDFEIFLIISLWYYNITIACIFIVILLTTALLKFLEGLGRGKKISSINYFYTYTETWWIEKLYRIRNICILSPHPHINYKYNIWCRLAI